MIASYSESRSTESEGSRKEYRAALINTSTRVDQVGGSALLGPVNGSPMPPRATQRRFTLPWLTDLREHFLSRSKTRTAWRERRLSDWVCPPPILHRSFDRHGVAAPPGSTRCARLASLGLGEPELMYCVRAVSQTARHRKTRHRRREPEGSTAEVPLLDHRRHAFQRRPEATLPPP